jgi:hypothetical protein
MARKKYNVLSPDGFTISFNETYPSRKKAFESFETWKKRYEEQGYYSSRDYGRIPLVDLVDYCQIIEV